jgi:hypothetical protein
VLANTIVIPSRPKVRDLLAACMLITIKAIKKQTPMIAAERNLAAGILYSSIVADSSVAAGRNLRGYRQPVGTERVVPRHAPSDSARINQF